MINFRYHLVSVAAILLALAGGVALGSGPLDEATSALSDRDNGSTDPSLARFEAGYAARTADPLLDGVLKGRSVVVMTLPEARADEVKGVRSDLEQAGANVTGEVGLTAKLIDPTNRQFAEGVAQQSASDVDGVSSAGESYGRVGAALSRAVLGKDDKKLDSTAATIASAFEEGGLVTFGEQPKRSASLAVVIAGPGRISDSGSVVTQLVKAFDAGGDGAVLAGPTSTSKSGGAIAVVRNSDVASQVSTVDVTDTAAGRVVVALALASEAEGDSGAWGTARSADGAVPR